MEIKKISSFKKILIIILSFIFLCCLTFLIGYQYAKSKIPEKVVIQEKEVLKEVEVIKKDVKIVERKISSPDGTMVEEKIIEDKSSVDRKTEMAIEKAVKIENSRKWEIGYMQSIAGRDIAHGVYIQREILGRFQIGAFTNNNGSFGMSVGIKF